MRVYYQTEFRPGKYRELTYEEIATEFCCDDMKNAWKEEAVIFGIYDSYGTSKDVSIGHCLPYPEGACWDSFPIKFCPFCAEEIKTIEKERKNFKKRIVKKEIETDVWEEIP